MLTEKSLSLEEALQLALEYAEQAGYADMSRKSIKGNLRTFMKWCSIQGICKISDIDTALLKTYFFSLKEQQVSGYTVKIKRNALLYLFGCLGKKRIITENPMSGLKIRPRLETKTWDVLTLEEMGVLLQGAEKRYEESAPAYKQSRFRDKLILGVLLATGIRCCELTALKLQDVSLEEGTLHIRGKGSNWYIKRNRLAFIDEEELLSELATYIEKINVDALLFPGQNGKRMNSRYVNTIVKKIASYAGLKKTVNPHLLRHSFCSFLIKQGADAFSVQRLMGHWEVQTTLRFYLHLTPGEVKNDWQKYSPLAGGET